LFSFVSSFLAALAVAVLPLAALAAPPLPPGWFLAGSHDDFSARGVADGGCGGPGALALEARATPGAPATVMTLLQADPYRGQRLRLSGTVATTQVTGRAGLWMRIDGVTPHQPLAFDTMQDRPLQGSQGCTEVSVVLDVPREAVTVAAGLVLEGAGRVDLSGVRFELVPDSVPVTDLLPRGLPPGAPGLAPEEVSNELGESRGRLGAAWFNDLVVESRGLALRQRNPGRWSDATQESVVLVEGDTLKVKLRELTGEFTVRREGGGLRIVGTWGGIQFYPVSIRLTPEQVELSWGFYRRQLTRERSTQVEPDCARYTQYSGRVSRPQDWLYACGAALEPDAPVVQTTVALLLTGFRRDTTGPMSSQPR
jgi:hypothetical protein